MMTYRLLMAVFAPLLLVPASARPQGALPEPLDIDLTRFVIEMNDAFNDDLEDICHCRNVAGATRFEEMVEKLKAMEEPLDPERIREGLLEEGIDIPVEPGETPRTYLERVRSTWSRIQHYEPLRERLTELQKDAEILEEMIQHGSQPGKGGIPFVEQYVPPHGVDREVEILRTLREALADCREDEEVPPPPEFTGDARAGLVIDSSLPGGDAAPPTPAALREALLHELRNLCCKLFGEDALGAWMGSATRGLDDAAPDVQAEGRFYLDLLEDLRRSMDSREFHKGDLVDEFRIRERCGKEVMDTAQVGFVLEEDGDDASEVGGPPDPSAGAPTPVPTDQIEEETDETDEEADEEPAPPDPPDGFRHVTRGSNPSRYTPESNHVAEGADASAQVRDFFEEGRGVPHVEDGVFTDRHLTVGEHASQYVDPELHLAEGPGASGLKRGGGGGDGDRKDEDEDEDDEDDEEEEREEEEEEEEEEVDESGGELAKNPGDHNPDEVHDATPARGVQRMIVEIDGVRTTDGQEGPGGSVSFPGAGGAAPDVYLISLGTSTGRTFRVHAVGESADLSGVVVVEPVAVPARERRRIDERLRAAGSAGAPADGYCLEYERLVPPPGTLFRLSSREVQAEHAPVRRILAAGQHLREAGVLVPDTDPERYFHSIRQWAIWTWERGFDEAGFAEAFVQRARENFRAAGQAWNEDVDATVRSVLPNRWQDIQAVLSEAGE